MKTRPLLVITLLITTVQANAQVTSYLSKGGSGITQAVDAKGVRHYAKSYRGKRAPWLEDLVKNVGPEYPYADRARHNMGVGWFALHLDLQTGTVTSVAILQSTGFASLDTAATVALKQWRWKPGKWQEIDIPVTFTMAWRS